MTVEQLITKLRQVDPKLPIQIWVDDYGWVDAAEVGVEELQDFDGAAVRIKFL